MIRASRVGGGGGGGECEGARAFLQPLERCVFLEPMVVKTKLCDSKVSNKYKTRGCDPSLPPPSFFFTLFQLFWRHRFACYVSQLNIDLGGCLVSGQGNRKCIFCFYYYLCVNRNEFNDLVFESTYNLRLKWLFVFILMLGNNRNENEK